MSAFFEGLLEFLAGIAEAAIPVSDGSWRWVLAWIAALLLIALVVVLAS